MSAFSRWRVAIVCGLVAACGLGCGSSKPAVHTVPVTGVVTLDDKPLSGAVVRYFDETGKNAPSAGTTDSTGAYKLGFSTYNGAIPGKYKVLVEYLVDMDGKPIQLAEGKDATMMEMEGKAKSGVHDNYSKYEFSQLKAEVTDGGKNVYDFKLRSDGT